jgi:hypothetical protein
MENYRVAGTADASVSHRVAETPKLAGADIDEFGAIAFQTRHWWWLQFHLFQEDVGRFDSAALWL